MTKYLKNTTIIAATAIIGLSGCSTNETTPSTVADLQKQIQSKDAQIAQLQKNAMTSSNREVSDKDAVSNSLIPRNAKPGECYAKVLVPAQYETKTIKKMVKEPKENIKVIPATYKVVDKKVTLREASTKLVAVPATYKTVTERVVAQPETTKLIPVAATYKTATETVMVEPEKTKLIPVPAVYKTVTEKIKVADAYTTWKKGRGAIEKIDDATGEILCLIEVPAVYKTVTKKVIATPATTKTVKIPAVYKTITRRVVATPATTKAVKIPAVYKTVTRKVIATPATTKTVKIPAICKIVKTRVVATPAREVKSTVPAVYTNVPMKVKTADSYLKWQEILCETNTTKNVVANLQSALKAKGYNITNVDGDFGPQTQAAVKKYQRDNHLNEGALTLQTLKSLGL